MKPRIEERGPFTFIGTAIETTMANNQIPALWDDFIERLEEIGPLAVHEAAYGICDHVDMEGFDENTPFCYMTAILVNEGTPPPPGMTTRVLPRRRYAMFTHRGPLDQLDETYQFIYGEWLPGSDEELALTEELEVYAAGFDPEDPEAEMEIWVALV